ncbi:amino acid ABC transporter permease [Candidatus Sodalis endolongispinus]|uniref:amino acid ABC transporter permease n=1 Tax=Candidatus Sodalis endolongispinus TaxID=2812662 RepID=UPI001FEAAB9A|nr:amino acid ABC transporter permease [Candidatus Sodalis endolongispinus]
MDLDFTPAFAGWADLLRGAEITIGVTAASLLLGCLLGMLIGIGRLNPKRRLVYGICTAYPGNAAAGAAVYSILRLPQFGVLLPAYLCGIMGLGVYSGAYVSEIVRGAIQSVERGQMEAARSVGMSSGQAMRLIIIPQAIVRMIPPLGNEFIALIKNSSLTSLLTIDDLMHEGQKIISVSYRSVEVYLVIAVIYLVMTLCTAQLLTRLERRLHAGGWCNERVSDGKRARSGKVLCRAYRAASGGFRCAAK